MPPSNLEVRTGEIHLGSSRDGEKRPCAAILPVIERNFDGVHGAVAEDLWLGVAPVIAGDLWLGVEPITVPVVLRPGAGGVVVPICFLHASGIAANSPLAFMTKLR